MIKRLLVLLSIACPCVGEDGGIRIVSWPTQPVSADSATVRTVSISNSAVSILGARPGRLKVTLFNEKETLYIKAGTGASISDYTWRIIGSTSLDITNYTGPITGVLGVLGPTTVHVTDF